MNEFWLIISLVIVALKLIFIALCLCRRMHKKRSKDATTFHRDQSQIQRSGDLILQHVTRPNIYSTAPEASRNSRNSSNGFGAAPWANQSVFTVENPNQFRNQDDFEEVQQFEAESSLKQYEPPPSYWDVIDDNQRVKV